MLEPHNSDRRSYVLKRWWPAVALVAVTLLSTADAWARPKPTFLQNQRLGPSYHLSIITYGRHKGRLEMRAPSNLSVQRWLSYPLKDGGFKVHVEAMGTRACLGLPSRGHLRLLPVLQRCDGSRNQRWYEGGAFRGGIRVLNGSTGRGMCLDGGQQMAQPLQMRACTSAASQLWREIAAPRRASVRRFRPSSTAAPKVPSSGVADVMVSKARPQSSSPTRPAARPNTPAGTGGSSKTLRPGRPSTSNRPTRRGQDKDAATSSKGRLTSPAGRSQVSVRPPPTDGSIADWLATVPALAAFRVKLQASKMIGGRMSTDPVQKHVRGAKGIVAKDTLGDFAMASLVAQGAFYRDGRYNDNDWRVQSGVLMGASVLLPAVVIHPPKHRAKHFLASRHGLFYRFTKRDSYVVYRLSPGKLTVAAAVSAHLVRPGKWTRLGTLTGNRFARKRTYIIAPKRLVLTAHHRVGVNVRAASVSKTAVGRHVQFVVDVPDAPYDTIAGFPHGPAHWDNHFGHNRHFFHVSAGKNPGVLWQSTYNGRVWVTWLSSALGSARSFELPRAPGSVLASATSDGNNKLYYLMIEADRGSKPVGSRRLALLRCGRTGQTPLYQRLDASKNGLNVWSFGRLSRSPFGSAMRYHNGTLGLLLARRMHAHTDGLNHQGAIAVLLDANQLTVRKNLGQTSGHSMENVLSVGSDGRFVAVDVGDNYPRGVHLHRFGDSGKKSRVVHVFKTQHGTSAVNPAGQRYPPYKELNGAKPYFKWSNDNSTYMELGGLAELDTGIAVVFAGERSSLNNAAAHRQLNASRNVAMVLVRKDFERASKAKGANVVTDDLVIGGDRKAVTGGYYSFNGTWMPQRIVGTRWLTNYRSTTRNASRVKVAKTEDGRLAIFWEQWNARRYKTTWAMMLDARGERLVPPTEMGSALRLNRRDDPFTHRGMIVHAGGRSRARKLVLDVVMPKR